MPKRNVELHERVRELNRSGVSVGEIAFVVNKSDREVKRILSVYGDKITPRQKKKLKDLYSKPQELTSHFDGGQYYMADCALCKKAFMVTDRTEYAYRRLVNSRVYYFCSWKCFREGE